MALAHHDGDHEPGDQDGLGDLVDLDAEVFRSYLDNVVGWVGQSVGAAPRRILDLGSGTGPASFLLAQRFPGARVTAVDTSEDMLERVRAKAESHGLGARVSTLHADLDEGWPDVGPVDLGWASLSLHHLANPDRVLRELFAAIAGGGLMVVAEMDSLPRLLPDDVGIGRPGLEARCHEALAAGWHAELPELGSDWGSRLLAAGFAPVESRVFDVDVTRPLPAGTGRYAQLWLQRLRPRLDGLLDAGDLATLDQLLAGPRGVQERDDLVARCTRTVWIAQRP